MRLNIEDFLPFTRLRFLQHCLWSAPSQNKILLLKTRKSPGDADIMMGREISLRRCADSDRKILLLKTQEALTSIQMSLGKIKRIVFTISKRLVVSIWRSWRSLGYTRSSNVERTGAGKSSRTVQ
ncbi:hypothetical protein NPIL_369871 [Nephila pilipes]|uniref:Uncharacterized protein n=1 Tax=Nephila pilipes TaxID=299642 RepID=A0A8X6TDF0_NEPPI|nr:hypothetical protein NPIL_369871 [Nephila pilipes]